MREGYTDPQNGQEYIKCGLADYYSKDLNILFHGYTWRVEVHGKVVETGTCTPTKRDTKHIREQLLHKYLYT